MANYINSRPDEIIFTGSGTESDNLALIGYARAHKDRGKHLIVSLIEHHAVLEAAQYLEQHEGFDVTYLKPDRAGFISPESLKNALRDETILVSVMYANNEIGTIQPIAEIGRMIKNYRLQNDQTFLAFHTDACQATAYLPVDVEDLHVDLLTLNGSKVYGPKGVGLLYKARERKIQPIQFGGGQERALRPGTVNVAGVVGLAKAIDIAESMKEKEVVRLRALRDGFVENLRDRMDNVVENASQAKRLPHQASLSFPGIDAETLLVYLDEKGIYVSTGAACASGSVKDSHVLKAVGLKPALQKSALRFTLGRQTTREDMSYVLKTLPEVVEKLR